MKWLERLKKIEIGTKQEAAKPTKPSFVGFVAPILASIQKTGGDQVAANDPAIQLQANTPGYVHNILRSEELTENDHQAVIDDPVRWYSSQTVAMSGEEIDAYKARLARFTDKGINLEEGEALSKKMVKRDRETDHRRLCLECVHLAGRGVGSWNCKNWKTAEVSIRTKDALMPRDLVQQLQCCAGFNQPTK